jgi:hypothetical protein
VVDWVVFAVTGSTAVVIARPVIKMIGIEGSFKDGACLLRRCVLVADHSLAGPWSYRVGYLSTMTPLYSLMLITNGTIVGRHAYFKLVLRRMWSHLLPGIVRR